MGHSRTRPGRAPAVHTVGGPSSCFLFCFLSFKKDTIHVNLGLWLIIYKFNCIPQFGCIPEFWRSITIFIASNI